MKNFIEGLWDCPNCDEKGIRGSIRICPNCGAMNSDSSSTCLVCQSARTSSVVPTADSQLSKDSILQVKDFDTLLCEQSEEQRNTLEKPPALPYQSNKEKPSFTHTEPTSPAHKIGSTLVNIIKKLYYHPDPLILSIFVLSCTCFFICLPFSQKVVYTVTSTSWERSLRIEEKKTYQESSWTYPLNGRLLFSRDELFGYDTVIDHYETVSVPIQKQRLVGYEPSKQVDYGFFEEVQGNPIYESYTEYKTQPKPVYVQVEVYKPKYYYEIDLWSYSRSIDTSGTDQSPYWGEPYLKEKERIASQSEKYFVTGVGSTGKQKKFSCDYSKWCELEIGKEIELKLSALGTVQVIY